MFGDTPLVMVDTPAKLAEAAAQLAQARVIGVDTEADSFYHYQEKVCLIQFSDRHADYIVDPLAFDDLSPLAPVMANPEIVKVFHGADYDVVSMKRDFGFEFRNLFDTMVSAQLLGLPRLGLADLIGRYFGWEIDKQYQRHNWAARPLLPEHLDYARGDTHWLLALRELLQRELIKKGRLAHLEEECQILEKREWAGRTFDEDGWLRIKGSNQLDDTGKRVLKYLYLYRDTEARAADRPTFKVLPDDVLLEVADRRPETDAALEKLFARKTAMKRRYGNGILKAVHAGLDADWPIPSPPRKVKDGPRARIVGRLADRGVEALKDWRNAMVRKQPGLVPAAVVSNGVMKQIVAQRPFTLEELEAVPEVRSWQVREYGEAILAVLDKVIPELPSAQDASDDEGEPRAKRRRRGGRRR